MAKVAGSVRKIKPEHKKLIVEEAARLLKGVVTSTKELLRKLHNFAVKKCRRELTRKILTDILWGTPTKAGFHPRTVRRQFVCATT